MSGQREEYMAMCLANFGSLLHDCFLAHSQFANFAFLTSCGRLLNSCLSDVHVITLLSLRVIAFAHAMFWLKNRLLREVTTTQSSNQVPLPSKILYW